MACEGLKPVCAIYSTFLQRGYDQMEHDVALQKLPVVFAMDRAGLVGEDGPTHHGVFDNTYLRVFPNMVVTAPGDGFDVSGLLDFAVAGKISGARFAVMKGAIVYRANGATTDVTWSIEGDMPVPILGGYVVWAGRGALDAMFDRGLANLKRVVEE